MFDAWSRRNQENLATQSKSSVHATTVPLGFLVGNGAYLVMVALAWGLNTCWTIRMPVATRHGQTQTSEE